MNPNIILALISDLYAQVAQLTEENERLRAALAQQEAAPPRERDDA